MPHMVGGGVEKNLYIIANDFAKKITKRGDKKHVYHEGQPEPTTLRRPLFPPIDEHFFEIITTLKKQQTKKMLAL